MLIRWNELSYPDLGAYRDQAAVMINFASTEQHSLHLPVGTDAFLGAAAVSYTHLDLKILSCKVSDDPLLTVKV